MSCEEFRETEAGDIPIGKLISIISKGQTIFINHKLNEFGINSTQLFLLYEIDYQDDINQEQIASRCTINKGAVARSIKKLEEKNLVKREIDSDNRRQNKVFLTPQGKDVLNRSSSILENWEKEVFDGEIINKEEFQIILKDIAIRIMEINEREAENEQKEE